MNTIDILGDSVCLQQNIEGTISEFVDDEIAYMREQAFAGCSLLRLISFPECRSVASSAFLGCINLSIANFSKCSIVYANAFLSCSNLVEIRLPDNVKVSFEAFRDCRNLSTVNFPESSDISAGAFSGCENLISVNLPKCTIIYSRTFTACKNLVNVNIPECRSIASYAFDGCEKLPYADYPLCPLFGLAPNKEHECGQFRGCHNLSYANFLRCSSVPRLCFAQCYSLNSISFPNCTHIGVSAFQECSSLTMVSFPNCSYIGSYAFESCHNLMSVYFLGKSLISLTSYGYRVFANTPMDNSRYTGSYGSIYVNPRLYSQYIVNSMWATYKNRFVKPVGIIELDDSYIIRYEEESGQIFGSIDITAFISDDLLSAHAAISDTQHAVIINETRTGNDFAFTVSAVSEGITTITVSAQNGQGETIATQCELIIARTWCEVQTVFGAEFGFELNSNNYYESKNKKIGSSYAICKLVFLGFEDNIVLECINSGESNYDFGLISNVDTMLTLSSAADTSGVFKSFKGASSTSPVAVTIPAPDTDKHFLCIKYRKDGTGSSDNDSLQFRVVESE